MSRNKKNVKKNNLKSGRLNVNCLLVQMFGVQSPGQINFTLTERQKRKTNFTFSVVLQPHVVEVVKGRLQHPDSNHVVLARRGQQPPAVRELHGPDGALEEEEEQEEEEKDNKHQQVHE